jgi:hypothetical protein
MKLARKRSGDVSGWNAYVDASIAFLKKDKSSLLSARRKLQNWPKPKDWPLERPWPQNLVIVDGFINCFDLSYAEALNVECQPKKN